MRSPIVIAAAAVLLAGGCQQPATFNPDDPAVTAEIEARLRAAMDGAAAVDTDRVLSIAQGESDLTFVTGDVMLSGIDTIRDRFRETYSGLTKQEQTIREKRVRILSPDVALVTAVGQGTYTDKAGWTSEPVGMGLTIVFVRKDGVWRACHAHQSIAF